MYGANGADGVLVQPLVAQEPNQEVEVVQQDLVWEVLMIPTKPRVLTSSLVQVSFIFLLTVYQVPPTYAQDLDYEQKSSPTKGVTNILSLS